MSDPILIAQHGETPCFLRPDKANRHGLITGATGTGKTITLQTMAEAFSRAGTPVFMADVKGDLTGISQKGAISPKLAAVLAMAEGYRSDRVMSWLNPTAERHWYYTPSIELMKQLVGDRMYPLTIEGLDKAMRELSR